MFRGDCELINWNRKLKRWLPADSDPWLELFVAVVSAFLSLQIGTDKNNLWSKVVNTATFAIVGGSVPLLIKLYIRLRKAVPTVDKLNGVLVKFENLETRLLPNLYVTETMKSFHEKWIDWRNSLSQYETIGELEITAWTLLAEAYLDEECRKLENRYVFTNTKRYTNLVAEAGKHLEKYHLSNDNSQQQQIVRHHITGMLPEEFYNGSQIEFTANSSQPIFFSHKWEGYQEFYDAEYQGRDQKSEIRRCILVRQQDLYFPEISALSTLTDLQEQAKLSIIPRERRVLDNLSKEIDSVQRRLFRKCSLEQQQTYRQLITTILGRQNYSYWPIARTEDCNRFNQQGFNKESEWDDLLDVFSRSFHGNRPSDASFCVLNEKAWIAISQDKNLIRCFKPGWIPEIVLFGGLVNGKETEEWYFGILGHWRPFTPDIELRFLTSDQTRRLYSSFTTNVYLKTKHKGSLVDLRQHKSF